MKKAKKKFRKTQEELVQKYLERGHAIIDTDKKQFVSDKTLSQLETAINKIETGIEQGNDIEVEAYGKAIPRILSQAEKEIYKATK